jgi:hypothetical protein
VTRKHAAEAPPGTKRRILIEVGPVVPLGAKHAAREALQPAHRLLEFIHRQPGASIYEASYELHLGHEATMKAVNGLLGRGVIRLLQTGKSVHLFPSERGLDDECCRQVVALRDEWANRIYSFLSTQGTCREVDLVTLGLKEGGAPRQFVMRRVQRLVEARLAEQVRAPLSKRSGGYRALPMRGPALQLLLPPAGVTM